MVSLIGAVFILATVWAVFFRQSSLIWILSSSVPFAATSAITVGENSIPPFYVVASVLLVSAVTDRVVKGPIRLHHPSMTVLFFFTIWSLGVTVFAPLYFHGIQVLIPRAGIDQQVAAPGLLEFSPSNIAQSLYLVLGVGVVVYVARREYVSPHILAAGFSIGSILSTSKFAVGDSWPSWIFDSYAGLTYNEDRFRGIFPEPSYLAVFSLAALTYGLLMLARSQGKQAAAYLILTASAGMNLFLSQSGTAALGVAVMIVLAIVVGLTGFLSGRLRVGLGQMATGLFLVAGLAAVGGGAIAKFGELVADKHGSLSFLNRSSADLFSMKILAETYGFGAGLGSSRPSSMLAMLISCTGVVGSVLFLLCLILVLRSAARNAFWLPTVWSLLALISAKFIAEPSLSTPLLWLLVGLCIYAGHGLSRVEKTLNSFERMADSKGESRVSGQNVA